MNITKIIGLIIAMTCGPAFGQEQCDPFAIQLTTTPSLPDSPEAMKITTESLANISAESDLLLIGDSIFVGWGKSVQESFPERKIWNFSVGGDRTQYVLWRMKNLPQTNISLRQSIIFIGTNNLSVRGASACSIFAGIQAIFDETKNKWPDTEVYIIGLPPRGADFHAFDELRLGVNALILSEASRLGYIPVILDDIEFTCGNYSRDLLPANTMACAPGDAYQCVNYRTDNLHLLSPGYDFLRGALREASIARHGQDRFE